MLKIGSWLNEKIPGKVFCYVFLTALAIYPFLLDWYGQKLRLVSVAPSSEAGEPFNYIDIVYANVSTESRERLTCLGIGILITIILVLIMTEILKHIHHEKGKKSKTILRLSLTKLKKKYELSQIMFRSNIKVRANNTSSISEYIDNNYYKKQFNVIITDPKSRVNELKEEFQKIVSEFFNEGKATKFIVELAYKIPAIDDIWKPIGNTLDSRYTADQLARNPRSTYWSAINAKRFIFINKKADVAKFIDSLTDEQVNELDISCDRYFADKDKITDIQGSIIATSFDVTPRSSIFEEDNKQELKYIEVILSVSSIDVSFVSDESTLEELKKKFELEILPNYERKLKLELALFFIVEINEFKKKIIGEWASTHTQIKFYENGKCEFHSNMSSNSMYYAIYNDLTLEFRNKSKKTIKRLEKTKNKYHLDDNTLIIGGIKYRKIE